VVPPLKSSSAANRPTAPPPELIAATSVVVGVYVQLRMSWTAVKPPVPPVKPTYAAVSPMICGMLTWYVWVAVASVSSSVIVTFSVVPLYVMATSNTSPLCRSMPVLVRSIAGTVGNSPSV
jgi:hypothetical protein